MKSKREEIKNFNIRVYGIYINNKKEVLLSDEVRFGKKMTKFPGGGLKFGEGTIDCLKREALEEFKQGIEIISHFYTTDFFQKAYFYTGQQLISIYYLINFSEPIKFKISCKPFDFQDLKENNQSLRFVSIKDWQITDLTFPIDQIVMKKLIKAYF